MDDEVPSFKKSFNIYFVSGLYNDSNIASPGSTNIPLPSLYFRKRLSWVTTISTPFFKIGKTKEFLYILLFIMKQAKINANETKKPLDVPEQIKPRRNMKGTANKTPLIPTLKAPPIQNNIDIAATIFFKFNFIVKIF